jgi:hypothetical protein
MCRGLLALLVASILTACQGRPLIRADPTPLLDEFTRTAQINGYDLKISCAGTGEPTIILEKDIFYTSWDISSLSEFRKIGRTCIYSRPDAESIVKPARPRTTLDQVNDLHELLKQTQIPGPYILVGYHMTSYNLILYTGNFPNEVAGLVCVDCRYPTFYRYFLDNLGSETSADSSGEKEARIFFEAYLDGKLDEFSWGNHPEYINQLVSEDQVREINSLGQITLLLLEAGENGDGGWGAEVNAAMGDAWRKAQSDLCHLSSKCMIEIVPNVATNQSNIKFFGSSVYQAVLEVYTAVETE